MIIKPNIYMIQKLFIVLILQSQALNWKDKENSSVESFSFLWDLFKKYYLPHAFEDFSYETSIYKCDLGNMLFSVYTFFYLLLIFG